MNKLETNITTLMYIFITCFYINVEKSSMADHIWKEKGNHLSLWDEVEIIDRTEHWTI